MQFQSAAFPIIPALGMFVAILIFLELGRRIGIKRLNVPGARAGQASARANWPPIHPR